MKKIIVIIGLLCAVTANADGLFGAGLKPKPNFTLFGQKITWAIPSLCIGAKAGVLPEVDLSPDGMNFKVPYFAFDIPFPSLTLKAGTNVVEVKVGAAEKKGE